MLTFLSRYHRGALDTQCWGISLGGLEWSIDIEGWTFIQFWQKGFSADESKYSILEGTPPVELGWK